MECDVSGIITKASKASCDVSFNIGGTTIVLPFGPSVFYSFGVRCEGNMSNILEEGTEVELCYRSSHAEYPCIVAVWLGEKPDCFSDSDYTDVSSEDTLAAVYDKVGRVVSVDKDTFIVKSDSCQVVVRKDVAFRDGRRFDVETTLEIDEEVTYDAIPCEDDASGGTHRATCAWIGVPPGLVERFRLDTTDERDKLFKVMTEQDIYGVVLVIPSQVLALVEVEFESSVFKVMLFRSSFKPACKRIQDKVAVGDTLCMRLKSRYIFGGRMQLFAANVVEVESTVEFEESVNSLTSVGNVSSCLENVSNCVEDLFNVDDKLVVLYSSSPLRGVISKYSYDSACISYGALKIFTDRDNFYMDGRKASVAEFMLFVAPGNNVVHFEAVPTTMYGFSHEATCAWVRGKPGLRAVLSSLSSPNFDLLEEKGKIFYGVVSKLCLPELAFVDISSESTTACIHVSECSSKSWYTSLENFRDEIGLISSYLGLKDSVQFRVERVENILLAREVKVVRSLDRIFSKEGSFRPPVPRRKNAYEVKARKAGLKKSGPKKGASKVAYSKVAAMTVTKVTAGEIPAATGMKATAVRGVPGKDAPTQKAGGKNATSQNNVGRKESIPCGQTASGKKAAGKNKAKKNAASQNAAGKNAASQNAAGKNAATQNAAGKNAATQNAAGKNAATQKASDKNAATQKAAGKNAASQRASVQNAATQKTSGKKAATQKTSGKKTAGQNAASHKASGKNAATQKASGKNAATQKASGKNAATQKASGKKAATQKSADKNAASQKASGQNAATQNASAKNAATQKASAKNAGTQKADGKKAGTQKADGKKAATQKAGAKKAAAGKSSTANNDAI